MNGAPLSKSTGVGNHLPLAHGRDERTHGGSHICIEEQVTKDIPAGIIVHERELIGRPIQIGEGDLLQEVPMPEAVWVVSFIEAPHGRRRGWTHRLVALAFEPLDGGGADREVFSVLKIPGDALRAKVRLLLDDGFCALNSLRR